MKMFPWKWAAWVAVMTLTAAGPPGWADRGEAAEVTPAAPPAESAPTAASLEGELKALRAQIDALEQKVKVLERQKEVDKEDAANKTKADAEKAKTTPVVGFKDGFFLKTPDDKYSLKINGRIAYDWAWFDQDQEVKTLFGDEQDGTGFRTARIILGGTVTKYIDWKAEFDFAGESGADNASFLDVYVQFNEIPYAPGQKGSLRLGHFKEPFSLEEITSDPWRTFNEPSLMNVFAPARNAGIMWSDALFGDAKEERFTYSLGVFKTTDNWPSSNDSDEDGGYNFTARVTGLPWYDKGGERLLHLGFGYTHRTPDGQTLGLSARPESRLSLFRYANADASGTAWPPNLFRLTNARAETVNVFNPEFALVYGPFSLQGEYAHALVDTTFGGSRTFNGYYVQASGFVTGEHRVYKHENGAFDRPRPKKNVGWGGEKGPGAWELAIRYAGINLSDGPVRGGEQRSLTAGVNWYFNPQVRFNINYIHGWVSNDVFQDGKYDMLQTRMQLDF